MASDRTARIERLMRTASTGDAPPDVQEAADDLFDCASAFAGLEDPATIRDAKRAILETAARVFRVARGHVVDREGNLK